MVRMVSHHSTSSRDGIKSKTTYYSEAEHDLKDYRREADDFTVYEFTGEHREFNDPVLKNPGSQALKAMAKAIKNKELTKDDFGLYDVNDEHQSAYHFATHQRKEELSAEVIDALDLLHEIRAEQVRSGNYDKDSKGQFRSPHRKRRGDYTYPVEKRRLAAKLILRGETLIDAALAIDADVGHLGQLLKKKYDLTAAGVKSCNDSRLGREAKRMREEGVTWERISQILRPNAKSHTDLRTLKKWIEKFDSGVPTDYPISDRLKELLG